MSKEMINHPQHYTKEGRPECIEEMKDLFGEDARVIFALLSAYKYDYRLGSKDAEEQELGKIKWYEDFAEKHIGECSNIAVEVWNTYWANKESQNS